MGLLPDVVDTDGQSTFYMGGKLENVGTDGRGISFTYVIM